MREIITCVSHGIYDVPPEEIPPCPICDQPMFKGERINLQTCDAGPGHPDLLRLVHGECEDDDDEE